MTDKKDLEQGVTEPTDKTPLLDNKGKSLEKIATFLPTDEIITSYNPEELTKWSTIFKLSGSIFMQRGIWAIFVAQIFVALSFAAAVFFSVKNPAQFSAEGSITGVIKTISVMITFLLGLFLSACVGRWWETVKSLEGLFGACKKLVMTAINLEVKTETRTALINGCVSSVKLLHTELKSARDPDNAATYWAAAEKDLEGDMDKDAKKMLFSGDVPPQQRSFYAWVVVSAILTDLRAELKIPSTNTPDSVAYQALCGLVQDALGNVSALKTVMAFQLPFVYAHMLAVMVHSANILTSVGTGITVGLMIARSYAAKTGYDANAIMGEFFFLLFQAFIYQAILTIGTALSFPVGGKCYALPLEDMTKALAKQLSTMNKLVDQRNTTPRRSSKSPP